MTPEPSHVTAVAGGITAFCPGSVDTSPGHDIPISAAQTAAIERNALLAITHPCVPHLLKQRFEVAMPAVDAVVQRHLDLP